MKKTQYRWFCLALLAALLLSSPGKASFVQAAEEGMTEEEVTEEHHLAFASDLHDTEGTLEGAFGNFPYDPEYVSLIGDMVGARGGDAPAFYSSEILERILAIPTCQDITADGANASIIWADHDAGVTDDAGIVKAMGDPAGYLSGLIYEGQNEDGSTAYYVYAVGFYHMLKGGDISREAAEAFKAWVAEKDVTIPVIVLCHAPLVAKRGDNFGATYWNEALNYAATGVEGITTEDAEGIPLIRNVFFLSGHNHTVDPAEYVYTVGSVMSIQVDTNNGSLSAEQQATVEITEAYDEEVADLLALAAEETEEDEPSDPLGAPQPNVTATGENTRVYYTAITPGYLKTSGSATLLTIAKETISLTKYNAEGEIDLGVTAAGEAFASPLRIERIAWEDPTYTWSEDLSTVTASRALKNNPSYKETETVSTTKSVTKEAGCTEKGETTYTAEFENPAFATQTESREDIEALGHDWEDPSYEWAEDNRTVTASRRCLRCGEEETETVKTSVEVTKEATESEDGIKTYTAVFSNTFFVTQTKTERIPAAGKEEEDNAPEEDASDDQQIDDDTPKDTDKRDPIATDTPSRAKNNASVKAAPATGDVSNEGRWAMGLALSVLTLLSVRRMIRKRV